MKDFSTMMLGEPCSSYEGALQCIWNKIPLNRRFLTVDKREVFILSRGTWNMESGPDFKNARVRIAGMICKGDVEIHVRRSDWDRHKHSEDPAYANVILHVVEQNDSETRDDLPTLILPSEKKIKTAPQPDTAPYGECTSRFEKMLPEDLIRFFRDAGLERIRMKSLSLLEIMIREGSGAAFVRKLFEQLGSKKNREAMNAVCSAAIRKYPFDLFTEAFEPVIWGESGLLPPDGSQLPAEAEQLVRNIWERWWALRPDTAEKTSWKRDGVRPLNSPEREIASVIAFLRRNGCDPLPDWAGQLMSASDAESFATRLVESFVTVDPFWDSHTSFSSQPAPKAARIVGENKARMLAIDVAIPCLAAFARLNKDRKLLDRVRLAAVMIPKTAENRITRDAFIRWFKEPASAEKLFSDACSRQGILHIYKQYCSAAGGDCRACLIRNSFHE